MTDTQYFKEKLQEEKRLVLQELREVAVVDPDSGEWGPKPEAVEESAPDSNDLGDRFEDFEEKNSLTNTLAKRLSEIEKALQNISGGTYGTCIVCGKEIEEERLQANPAAETCVAHLSNPL